jgi:uncharacterized protein (TIGR02594 family)
VADPARVLAVARKELGVKESPPHSNSGTRVRVYQQHTFLKGTGWPWCNAFVNFVMDEAGVYWPYKSAGAYDSLRWYTKAGWRTTKPAAGDVAVFNIGSGHIAIVTDVDKNTVHTIDGNHGDSVSPAVRSRATVAGFIHPPALSAKPSKHPPPKVPWWVVATSESGTKKFLFAGPPNKALAYVRTHLKPGKSFDIRRGRK